KSTVHKDVTERLPRVSKDLARKVKRILDLNKAERHIRGGEATRRKYRRDQKRASLNAGARGAGIRRKQQETAGCRRTRCQDLPDFTKYGSDREGRHRVRARYRN